MVCRELIRSTLCGLILVLVAASASAHVVYQRRTLRQWAQGAGAVAVAEILSPLRVWAAPDGSDHQEYFSVHVVERLGGELLDDTFDVFPHAEGEPRFRAGDRVLLFLDRTAEHAEFAHLATRFPYFTTQGAGDEWKLDVAGEELSQIALAWRALRAGGAYSDRRDLLLRQLQTSNHQLRLEALAELVQLRATDEFLGDREGIRRMTEMVHSERLTVAERIGLIRVLEGSAGFSAAAEIVTLADKTDERTEKVAVIRACGVLREPQITDWLRRQLETPIPAIQVAALISLGNPWHGAAVPEIAALPMAGRAEPQVLRAAVRALGGIASDEAVAALRAVVALDRAPLSRLAGGELERLSTRR